MANSFKHLILASVEPNLLLDFSTLGAIEALFTQITLSWFLSLSADETLPIRDDVEWRDGVPLKQAT